MTEAQAAELWQAEMGKVPDRVTRFPTGSFNFVFLVEAGGEKSTLRIAPPGQSQALAGTLYWTRRLADLGLPIPRVLACRPDAQPPFALLNYLPGQDLGLVHAGLSEEQKRGVAREVIRCQRILAQAPPAQGYGYLSSYDDVNRKASWKAVVASSLLRSRTRIRDNGIFTEDFVDRVEARLDRFEDYFASVAPVPFFDDATTKNVLVHEGRFSGILDLDWLCFGDRLYTIALTRMSLLSARQSLSYIDFLIEEEGLSPGQLRVLDFYTLVFCVDFMAEKGMRFNKAAPPIVTPGEVDRLTRLYRKLLSAADADCH